MKKIFITPIIFSILFLGEKTFSQENTNTFSNLSIGLFNQFFRFNGKSFRTISPTVEFQLLKQFYILSQYERFREFDIEDISNVRDGLPRVISKKNSFYHIPLTFKYSFIKKEKINYYLKISEINQFRKNITSVYTFNNPLELSEQNEFNILYGFSAGLDFVICEQHKVGLEAYFKNGKNLYSEIFGMNLIYMFNLNVYNHEK